MPQPVIDATIGRLNHEATIGGYRAAGEAAAGFESAYGTVARFISARAAEIAIGENATRAWDIACYAIPFGAGDRILTSMAGYASNLIAFLHVAALGVSVEVIRNDEFGQISVDTLADLLADPVKVVAISHMAANGGLLQRAARGGALSRQSGAIHLLDACQPVGQLPVDADKIRSDILTATSWDARRFGNWEFFGAGRLGMAVAIDHAAGLGLARILGDGTEPGGTTPGAVDGATRCCRA